MAQKADRSIQWCVPITALAGLSKTYTSSSVFLLRVLQLLKEETGCSRATYLRLSLTEGVHSHNVIGETYPSDRAIAPLDAHGLTFFGQEIALQSTSDSFYEGSILKEGKEHFGFVIQVYLGESGEQHAVSLSYDSEQNRQTATAGEQHEAFDFVRLLAQIVNSKYLSEAEKLRGSRFNTMKEILSQTGTVKDVAQKICQIWRNWLKIPAIRLWAFNDEFDELNLLSASFDNQYTEYFEKSSNRLSSKSIGSLAIARRSIIRADKPMSNPEWDTDVGLIDLMDVLPYLICIPVISPDVESDNDAKPKFIGLIDLHVGDISSIDLHVSDISSTDQPDSRLLFLGTITADALLRARSFESYEIIRDLSQMAIELVNPKDLRPLSERKDIYLGKVKDLILQAVNARCVSIFEADESRDTIRCVATTGIEGESDFHRAVFYRAEEQPTWEVFASGKYCVRKKINRTDGTKIKEKFGEQRTVPMVEDHDPYLLFPLPGQTPEATTGVIRIAERTCSIYKDRLQNFSNHDVDLIKLIAHQMSPALQMIRMQAHRELFVERTAHQVIQPLQGVIAYVANILDGLYDEDVRRKKLQYIRQMARAAVGMMRSTMWASAVTDFGFLSHIDRAPVKLTEYFIERIIDLQPLREHEGIRVSFVNPEEADSWGEFLVDEQFFEQVVQNLLHNAVKYSYPRTKVELRVQRDGKDLSVFVASTGVPLDLSDKERIFGDRERGLIASRYDPQGTGQGLYIARQIMRGFGGTVTIESTVEDKRAAPPFGFPSAEKSTFKIIYPEAFQA